MKWILVSALLFFFMACSSPDPVSNVTVAQGLNEDPALRAAIKKIEPFFERMRPPEQYDWLGSHREPGQTFEEYLNSNPTKPTHERQKIYVLPLGKFTVRQKEIINLTANYLKAFYDLPVTVMPSRPLTRPTVKNDSRQLPVTKTEQLRTGYIMDKLLKPILPADGAALIAFTAVDLFPDSSMHFVFGQASLSDRVGVWSLKRLSDKTDNATFLRRSLKIAIHETGHMFSLMHCTKYECVMSGTNHLGETDRRPIDACPECMAKVCWMSGVSPSERYGKLAAFCRKNSLRKEAEEFEKKLASIEH
ncbi:MAG: hypothetical protein IPL32_14265 [Chloracidobacterium sp.]|nr:hypothetical protein [Chloracidobacterium sp.]